MPQDAQMEKNTGSATFQITRFTQEIKKLTSYLKEGSHKKDYLAKRALIKKVGRRERMKRYLKRKDFSAYTALCQKLGLRK